MAICQLVSPDFYWRVYRYCKISQKPQPSHCIHFLRKEDKIDKKSGSLVIDEGSPEGHWTNGSATPCQKRWHSKIRLDKNTLITCERDVGAGQNVGGGVRLHMGQGGGHQGGHSVQPDNTTLKWVQ